MSMRLPIGREAEPVLLVRRETPDQLDVSALLAAADERSASLYPAESRHGLDVPALLLACVRFFVARRSGDAEGCGGYVLLSPKAAEMKRLFVDPAARGHGVGGAIVQAIESAPSRKASGPCFWKPASSRSRL